MRHQYYLLTGGALLCLTILLACTEIRQEQSFATKLFSAYPSNGKNAFANEPGDLAFQNFLDELTTDSAQISQQELSRFLPDSILHADHQLQLVEIDYTDSRRMIYIEFSKSDAEISHPYLLLFSKGGSPLSVLKMKEATFNGYSSVQLIDENVLEFSYYDVYDEEGQYIDDLTHEYFKITPQDKFQPLYLAENVSEERVFPEASLRLLSNGELSDYDYAQLSLMKNEILADHGYWFRDKKWEAHFEKQTWYIPRFDDVNHRISGIELVNMEKIDALKSTF